MNRNIILCFIPFIIIIFVLCHKEKAVIEGMASARCPKGKVEFEPGRRKDGYPFGSRNTGLFKHWNCGDIKNVSGAILLYEKTIKDVRNNNYDNDRECIKLCTENKNCTFTKREYNPKNSELKCKLYHHKDEIGIDRNEKEAWREIKDLKLKRMCELRRDKICKTPCVKQNATFNRAYVRHTINDVTFEKCRKTCDNLRDLPKKDEKKFNFKKVRTNCEFFSHPYYGSDKKGKCKLTSNNSIKDLSRTDEKKGSTAASPSWRCDIKYNIENTVSEYKSPSGKKEKEEEKKCIRESGIQYGYNTGSQIGKRSVEDSFKKCEARCLKTQKCNYFSWWGDGSKGCHIFKDNKNRSTAASNVYSGDCDSKQGEHNCYIKKGGKALDKNRVLYNGDISKTVSGKTCQRWDKQDPQKHIYSGRPKHRGGYFGSTKYRHIDHEIGLTNGNGEAVCANPDRSKGPWCYTIDPKKRWEYCNKEGDTHTKSKRRCQQWHHHSPQRHGMWSYDGKKGQIAHNYCRDMGNGSGRPWCYTTDPNKRWEYCDVPECDLKKIGKNIKIKAIKGVGDCTNHKTGQYLGKDLTKKQCAARCKARKAKYMTHGRKKGNTSKPCTKANDECRCYCSTTCSDDKHSAYRAYEVK